MHHLDTVRILNNELRMRSDFTLDLPGICRSLTLMKSHLQVFSKFTVVSLAAIALGCGGSGGGSSEQGSPQFMAYYLDMGSDNVSMTLRSFNAETATTTNVVSDTADQGFYGMSRSPVTGAYTASSATWDGVSSTYMMRVYDAAGTLLRSDFDSYGAEISRDGTRIASYSPGTASIKVMDFDGGNVTSYPQTFEPHTMSWHPDGTKLLITYGDEITVMDLANSGATTEISMPSGQLCFKAFYNHDGTKIVFQHDSAQSTFDVSSETLGLGIADADGSNVQHLASVGAVHDHCFTADGSGVMYAKSGNIYYLDLETLESTLAVTGNAYARYLAP